MDTPMANASSFTPTYTMSPPHLYPRPPMSSHISDFHLTLLLPVLTYWLTALFWSIISYCDIWSSYRIHTPAEIESLNRVTIPQILRSILGQQLFQTAWGLFLGYCVLGTEDMVGSEDYDIAMWAERVVKGYSWIQWSLRMSMMGLGLDLSNSKGSLHLPVRVNITTSDGRIIAWEMIVAQVIYWLLAPVARFAICIFISDSWQYFGHRAFHENRWLYRNVHSLHHRVNAPYAFAAFYNTLTESFIMDTCGISVAFYFSGLHMREALIFSIVSVLKGVDDHCGYRLPWNPIQWLGEQDTSFHDIHHQTWGATTNFSQVYTIFWDHVLGTISRKTPEEIEELYKKGRENAEKAKKVN
ncbi:hypothetical protein BOTNAR_0207g00170 [Botryotinia narcissicola]|uniref:Fatty acid hydroxylase domain-containing protein n=1 Tax=Botryotinia narcissicola TaxID=278944 RepID=A0A4Z1I8X1_9HELO|nr:hypothetical protein BOTNAR_0207g00170 [Botryotinia narcissicola]